MPDSAQKPFQLLLIEDEPVIADLTREMVGRDKLSEFQVTHALSLADGLKQMEQKAFDAILLDLSLPDSQGLATFRTVSGANPDVPIVILSALNDEGIALEAVKHGAQEYLVKGEVDMKVLPRFIRYAIERQRIDTALRKSEERFATAMQATNDVIWDWNLSTNQVWWSDNVYNHFHYKPEEVRGNLDWWADHVHPEDKTKFLSTVEAVIHSGWQFWSAEYRFRKADGTYVPVYDRGYIVQDKEGTPLRMIGAMTDITDRKRAEETLRDFTAVLANVIEGISSVDLDGKYFQANRAFAEMHGYERNELPGMEWRRTVHPDDHLRMEQAYETMLKEGKAELEVRGVRKDGSFFFGQVVLIRGHGPEMTGHYRFMRDISERKRLEQELVQAQKIEAVGQLAGGIAHDFNNVLAALVGYARLAQDAMPEGSELREYMDEVLKAGKRATDLVGQIASFSRRPAAAAAAAKTLSQLDVMVREIVKFLRPTLPPNVFITSKIPHEVPPVMVDPSEIQQVVVNLCMNGCQAMPKGGTLTVSLEPVHLSEEDCKSFEGVMEKGSLAPGGYVVLSVEDMGSGIKADVLPRIFDASFSTRKGSSGMGLKAVYNFVKTLKGDIRVHSDLGLGTKIDLFLPAAAPQPKPEGKVEGPVSGGPESILVVDDEEAVAELLGTLLEALGYKVTVYKNSLDALAHFRDNVSAYDLVVTDQIMPALTGDKLAEEISSLKPGIPIILCSGYAHILSDERMKQVGIKKFLTKPLGRKELEKEIRILLDQAKGLSDPSRVM